jgi:hypothetical protein
VKKYAYKTQAYDLAQDMFEHYEELVKRITDIASIPSKDIASLSLSLGKLATQDVDASSVLYRRKLFGPSMFHLQQAVEKSAKGFGLLVSILKPDDLKYEVGHKSIIAILLRGDEFQKNVYSFYKYFLQLDIAHNSEISKLFSRRIVQLQNVLTKPVQNISTVDPEMYGRAIDELRDAKQAAQMWKDTLNLGLNNELVKTAVDGINNNITNKQIFSVLINILKSCIGPPLSNLIVNLFAQAGSRVYALSMLTMWHEKEPRYPAVEKEDY